MLFVNDNVQKSEGYYIVKIYKETLQKMLEKHLNRKCTASFGLFGVM